MRNFANIVVDHKHNVHTQRTGKILQNDAFEVGGEKVLLKYTALEERVLLDSTDMEAGVLTDYMFREEGVLLAYMSIEERQLLAYMVGEKWLLLEKRVWDKFGKNWVIGLPGG